MGSLYTGSFRELEGALVSRVRELREGRPLAPVTIVVGSSPLRTHIGDVLVRELGAVANVTTTTLASFAAQTAARAGGAPHALAGIARERLVRRLVAREQQAGHLRYFGAVGERPHFARALAVTIADLREAALSPRAVWAHGASGAQGQARAADLSLLYAAYAERLASLGVADQATVFEVAAQAAAADAATAPGATCAPDAGAAPDAATAPDAGVAPDAAPAPDAAAPATLFDLVAPSTAGPMQVVLLYGLYDLNGVQEAFVDALLQAGADAFVPGPTAAAAQSWPAVAAARRAGCTERDLPGPPPVTDLDLIADVAARLPGDDTTFAGDGSLAVVSVQDERAEAREAAREVLAALLAGAHAWECAVIVPADADKERAAEALAAAGLPVACLLPDRSAAARAVARLLDCVAPVAGKAFSRRAVLDLLAAAPPHAAVDPRLSALWPDEARRAGVVGGLQEWCERVKRRCRGLERRLEELSSSDAAADDDESRAALARHCEAARTLLAAVQVLRTACEALPRVAGWGEWARAFATLMERVFGPELGAAAADAAAGLGTLEPLDERVDLDEAAAVLREHLAAARTPLGRVTRDGVAVLTPHECRGLRFHTVVFTGLAEGGFPTRGRPDPLFGDAERRRLAKALGVRLPLAEERDAETSAMFAIACQSASARLALLAPRTEAATGRPRLPSRTLLRLASAAAGRPVGLDEFLRGDALRPVWSHVAGVRYTHGGVYTNARERDVAVLLELSGSGGGEAAGRYLAAVLDDRGAAQRRTGQWRAARRATPGAWDGLLGDKARELLASRHPFAGELRPTRLERYITCPFAFLLSDVYGLEPPEEPGDGLEMEPREFGNLAHKILQRTYQAVIAGGLGADDALAELLRAWAECCDEAERRGVTGAPLAWSARREALREDLLAALRADPVFASAGVVPLEVEWSFGEAHGREVSLALDQAGGTERSVRFAGRIDRIDASGSGRIVIDYKTGSGAAEKERLKDGLSVQLLAYRLAVREAYEVDDVTAEYRMVTRRGGFQRMQLDAGEEAALARLRQLVGEAIELVDQGVFPRTRRGRCDSCDLRYACGTSAWSRSRKRRDEALERVVALQCGAITGEDGADD